MASERRSGHLWSPIKEISEGTCPQAFPELDELLEVWAKRHGELREQRRLTEFQNSMIRSWSIETGIIEDLYTISENATLTLVEQGFDAALISTDETNLPAAELISILKDHQEAAEGLFAFVKQQRPLTTSYIKELHGLMTRHQQFSDGQDPHGHRVKVPLVRGEWKLMPNNPGDAETGQARHEYCPPEQVASEMDRLVELHRSHNVHFLVEAAWLHHRFAQIHPFQDGNGRVARALASLVAIRDGGFPILIMREQKPAYIRALETADQGDLAPLIEIFQHQQLEAARRAVSLSGEVLDQAASLEAILADAKQRLEGAGTIDKHLAALCQELTMAARTRMEQWAQQLTETLGDLITTSVLGSDTNPPMSQLFEAAAAQVATVLKYQATFDGVSSVLALSISSRASKASPSKTTTLVLHFHQMGPRDAGVLAATVLAKGLRPSPDENLMLVPAQILSKQPITFTTKADTGEKHTRFAAWLEESFGRGFDRWRSSL